eukprot:s1032_g17.t1
MGCGRCLRKCATRVKKIFEKVEYAAVAMCGFGTAMVMIGTAIPRWRLDERGTKPLENVWSFSGFESKSYGLMTVYAKSARSWDVIVRMTCEWQGLKGAQIGAIIQQGWHGDCDGSQQCGDGFTNHVYTRCIEYDRMQTVSMAVLFISMLTIILAILGILMACFGSLRLGGCAYGLLLFAGFVSIVSNVIWAVVTWVAFSNLGEDAWYPYPSLAIGWFVHLYGGITLLVSSAVFGWLVMPLVHAFDAEKSKLQKRKNKLMMMSWWNRDQERDQFAMHQHMPTSYPQNPPYAAYPADQGQGNFQAAGGLAYGADQGNPAYQANLYGAPYEASHAQPLPEMAAPARYV